MSKERKQRRDEDRKGVRLGTREQHHEFILDNWDHLAAIAWEGFKEDGRGFLTIEVDKVQSDPGLGERFPAFLIYIAANMLREKGLPFPHGDVEAMVEKYDPETQIVVFFFWRSGTKERQSAYRMGSQPAPRDTPTRAGERRRRADRGYGSVWRAHAGRGEDSIARD